MFELVAADVIDVLRLVLPLAIALVIGVVIARSELVSRLRQLRSAQRRVGLARVGEVLPTKPRPDVSRIEISTRAGGLAFVVVAAVIVVASLFGGLITYVVGAVALFVVLTIGVPIVLVPATQRRRSFAHRS